MKYETNEIPLREAKIYIKIYSYETEQQWFWFMIETGNSNLIIESSMVSDRKTTKLCNKYLTHIPNIFYTEWKNFRSMILLPLFELCYCFSGSKTDDLLLNIFNKQEKYATILTTFLCCMIIEIKIGSLLL